MSDITVKYRVLKVVEEMPPEITFEEVMKRVYFLDKVDRGLKQVEAGDIISGEAAKKVAQKVGRVNWTNQPLADIEASATSWL
ncbi:hypothetical protein QUA43_29635 [Microcoleus sp. N9_B4]|uniref:hypothetical protein n=1 Tax=Microcoleus sp. N9_B4 TaxID=3055386 RepID=UPI002FCF43AD